MIKRTVVIGVTLTLIVALPAILRGQTTVVRAARMLDVETGRFLEPAVVVIESDRITAVNPDRVPRADQTVELGDRTLLPGLIDLHTHLTADLEEGWQWRPVVETAADRALRGARAAHVTLQAGFTTVRDLWAGRGRADVALMKAIERDYIPGPRVVPSGAALGITGGHCEITGFAPGILELGPKDGVADGADEVVKSVRYQVKHGAKVIKVCATAGVLSFEGPAGAQQYTEEELRAIVEEAARHEVRVAAHAHGTEGIIAATRAGVISIEHGSILSDEAAQLMLAAGTWMVPNVYLLELDGLAETLPPALRAKWEYVGAAAEESFRLALRAGVKIGFGTDAGVFPHGLNAREFQARVRRGMEPLEAIRGATLYAAEVLGVDDRGVIAPGRLADLIAVEGDPLSDVGVLEEVSFVMKGGKAFRLPGS